MSRRSEVKDLLEQKLGPATPEVSNVTQITDDTWAVGHLGNTLILVQLDSDDEQLVLSAGLGRPQDGARAHLYDALLAYNALWRDTGGVTMGLVDGQVVQVYGLDAAQVDLPTLATALQNFAVRASTWR